MVIRYIALNSDGLNLEICNYLVILFPNMVKTGSSSLLLWSPQYIPYHFQKLTLKFLQDVFVSKTCL